MDKNVTLRKIAHEARDTVVNERIERIENQMDNLVIICMS